MSRIRWSAGLAALGRLELNEGGAGGRLYVERLAATLAVHLLRSSGLSRRSLIPHRGGLAPRQVRRVLEYIEAHLTDELGLAELAAIVELSPHYFGEAFRISTGRSPHRYVMERRVECARDHLWDADWPIPASKAIFDPELWQIVQDKLAANRQERSLAVGAEATSLLAGLIVDADGVASHWGSLASPERNAHTSRRC